MHANTCNLNPTFVNIRDSDVVIDSNKPRGQLMII